MTDTKAEWEELGSLAAIFTTVAAFIVGLSFVIGSHEPVMMFHGALLAAAAAVGGKIGRAHV